MTEGFSIGERLRTAREKVGLGVIQVAERLHVDPAVIVALESGQFSTLGPPVYVRGHLRRYAELLGEPDAPLQAHYAALHESGVEPDLTIAHRVLQQSGNSHDRRWPKVLLAGVVVIAAVIWWALKARPAP